MLERLAASPRLRLAVLIVMLGFCGYGLYAEWPQVTAELARLHWYTVALSALTSMAGAWCMMLAWRAILADFGSRLPLRAATRVQFIAQLGKYVPGAVWTLAAQLELGHDMAVPRRRNIASYLVAIAVTVAVGLGIAAVALPLGSPGLARHYWWALLAVPVIAVGLCPPVLGRLMNRVLGATRRQSGPAEPELEGPTWRGLAHALCWTLAGWPLLSAPVWLLLDDMRGGGTHTIGIALGGFTLAFSVAVLLIIFPSGIGAREVILIAALSPVAPHGTAVAIALVSRVVSTFADLAWGAVGLVLRRTAGRTGQPVRPGPVTGQPGRHRRTAV